MLLLAILLYVGLIPVTANMCPLSSTLNSSGYFGYPVDIFDVAALSAPRAKLVDCTTPNSVPNSVLHHNCSLVNKVCPITEENVHLLTRHDNYYVTLCPMFRNLITTNNSMRLVAYGGSVTVGVASEGGYISSINERSPWLTYLGNWINTTYPNRMRRFNLGYPAHTSYRMQDIVLEYTKKNGIIQYNSNDLIFLDFAMNDNICGIAAEMHQLKVGVESMVRKIHVMSDSSDPPAIVLLDGMANREITGACSMRYIEVYKNISNHYKIPLWSYRDAVTLVDYTTPSEKAMEPYIWWQNMHLNGGHPAWFVHLFTAELYARVLLEVLHNCSTADHNATTTTATGAVAAASSLQLPPPLYTDTDLHCNVHFPPLLSVSYDDVINNEKDSAIIGTFRSEPAGSWLIREDVAGKGGFIREFNYTGGSSGSSSNTSGSLRSRTLPPDNTHNAKLVFTLNMGRVTVEELVRDQHLVHLKVEYLRTYNNAGYADVYFCGKRVMFKVSHIFTGIDALWVDYQHFHYSLPAVLIHQLDFRDCLVNGTAVTSMPPTVEIVHRDALNVTSVNLPALHHKAKEGETFITDREARGNQKVKIMGVSICISSMVRR